MSISDDRQQKLISETRDLRDFYHSSGQPEIITLFAEDFDFLKKRKAITEVISGFVLDGELWVAKGYRKRRIRKKRPKESLF